MSVRKWNPVIYVFGKGEKRDEILSWLKEAEYGFNDHEKELEPLDPKKDDYRLFIEETLDMVELTNAEIEQLCTMAIVIISIPSFKNALSISACWDLDIPIIAYSEEKINDPWAIYYCDAVAINREELIGSIEELRHKRLMKTGTKND